MRVDVYKDNANEYRWRLISPNNQIVADSAEGYKTRWGAEHAATKFLGLDNKFEKILLAICTVLVALLLWALIANITSSQPAQPQPIVPSNSDSTNQPVTQQEIDQHNAELNENIGK